MSFTALVMAGSRPAGDPLATATGVSHKALTPVAGMAMVTRVIRTLRASTWVERIVVCGLDPSAAGALADEPGIELVAGDRSPGASAAHAITTLGLQPPILITTADHPLLTAKTLDGFCARAAELNADATFGLVPARLVQNAFPGVRRTAFRFRDGGFCGCNLYALLTPAGCNAPTTWTRVEAHRKKPWRMLGVLGYGTALRFVLGRLALADLTGLVFARTGLRVRPVFLTDPAAGFDVDTPEQRQIAEAFLASRS